MKLSQLTTDETLDVLCAMTPFVVNIVSDEALMETIGKAVEREGLTRAGMLLLGLEKLSALVPIIARDHRTDLYGIVAAVNGAEPEQIAGQNALKTMTQLRDICRDRELLSFFRSFAEREGTA